jgi:hypothetical protein
MSSEFQNRLRQSLDQPSPGQHPAPDVLNSYIERVLPAPEERQVLAHLSACAECREIVYLASCAAEEPATAAVVAPLRRVRWWTWAVPVAAVLIVASTVFLLQKQNLSYMKSAAPQEIAQARRDAAPPEMAPQVSPSKDSAEKQSHITPPRLIEPKLSKETQPFAKDKVQNPSAPVAPKQSDRLETYSRAQSEAKAAPTPAVRAEPSNGISPATGAVTAGAVAAAPPPPAQNQTVQVTSETAMVDVQTADEAKNLALNAPAKSEAAQNAYLFRGARAKKIQSALDWRVSPDGKLEHLLLGEWKQVSASPQAQFLTVSSVGADIWAAGKNLALYHSSDNGVNWERQSLPAATTDIVHIEFASATIGILKTSSVGAFSTHDGGKTWIAADQSP